MGWQDGKPDGSAGVAHPVVPGGEWDHRKCPLHLPISQSQPFLSKAASLKHTLRLASEIILHNIINARREKHKTEENEKRPETEITQGEEKSADYSVA